MNTVEEGIEGDDTNFQTFRDCIFEAIVNKSSASPRTKKKPATRRRQSQTSSSASNAVADSITATAYANNDPDPAELADFSDYLATEIFSSLPPPLRTINHITVKDPTISSAAEAYSLPLTLTTLEDITSLLPPTVPDTLTAYALTNPPRSDTTTFLSPILTSYISSATRPPPAPSSTRTSACELCERDWIPLTYHHLIPKAVHARVVKRGWHPQEKLNDVAWLCRACHSFVHRVAGNEELAREWFTVERLRGREDVRKWVGWVGGVRWKKR